MLAGVIGLVLAFSAWSDRPVDDEVMLARAQAIALRLIPMRASWTPQAFFDALVQQARQSDQEDLAQWLERHRIEALVVLGSALPS